MAVSIFSRTEFQSLEAGSLPYCKDVDSARHIIGGFNIFQKFLCKVDGQAHKEYTIKKEHFETACKAACGMPFKVRAPSPDPEECRRLTRYAKKSNKVYTTKQQA